MAERRTRIKICGLKTAEQARLAIDCGADAIGLVFARRSSRYVGDQALGWAARLPGYVAVVGVFARIEHAMHPQVTDLPLTMLQIHGEPTAALVKSLMPRRVIIGLSFDPPRIEERLKFWLAQQQQDSNIAGLLIDTPDPRHIGGGTGQTFDWAGLRQMLHAHNASAPIILAGGLDPDNVAEAIAAVRPYAVDVSSGVESAPGEKDPARIRAFCQAVREADQTVD